MRGLRGSNIYVVSVAYVGQNIFYLSHKFYMGCVGQNFLSKFLCGYFVCVCVCVCFCVCAHARACVCGVK